MNTEKKSLLNFIKRLLLKITPYNIFMKAYIVLKYKSFYVNSSGNLKQRFKLTENEIINIWDTLNIFSEKPSECLIENFNYDNDSLELFDFVFKKYGSDKSDFHNYHYYYSTWHHQIKNEKLSILEIGLGTNNKKIASNMGVNGSPLASLNSWKDLGFSKISGADIDKDLLNNKNWDLFYCDQLNFSEFSNTMAQRNVYYDFIIDDGLHSINSNLITLKSTWDYLNTNGIYIIEDVHINSLNFWRYFLGIHYPKNSKIIISKSKNCLIEIKKS